VPTNFPEMNLYRGFRQISTGKFVDRLDGTDGDNFDGMSADADALDEVSETYGIGVADLDVVISDSNLHTDDDELIVSVVPWSDREREKRNQRLADSDWTQMDGSPLSDSKKAEWATYRQTLRDLPAVFPNLNQGNGLEWPTEPAS
jgi:hypothetical protein